MSKDLLKGGRPVDVSGELNSLRAIDVSAVVADPTLRMPYLRHIIRRYQHLENLENDHPGKPAHGTLLDDFYSRGFLPVLGSMLTYAERAGDNEVAAGTIAALGRLNNAMTHLDVYADETGEDPESVLAAMQEDDDHYIYADFQHAMNEARGAAVSVITDYLMKVPESEDVPLEKQRNGIERTFRQEAELVLRESNEARGIDLGKEFERQLYDPNVHLVVIMLDINSTLNMNESFANLANLVRADNRLRRLLRAFKKQFPEKRLLIVPNTGRPADYARGVFDMLPALTEIRTVGFAEAGGVLFRMKGSGMETHVPVEDELQWQQNLEDLYVHLNKQIDGGHLGREHKLSMLSNELAEPAHDGGAFLHSTIPLDGKIAQKVDDAWVKQEVEVWFEKRAHELEEDLANGNGDPRQIQEKLAYLLEMQKVLIVKFNKTAGYVDIFHKDINKFSSSLQEFRRMGFEDSSVGHEYSPDQMLVVHIGDTMTDLPPSDRLAQGEPNYGADRIFTVAVGNSAPAFKEAIEARGKYGYIAARYAALAVGDVFEGIRMKLPSRGRRKASLPN